MIDYNKTIEKFLKSADEFLTGKLAKVDGKEERAAIEENIANVRRILSNPKKYSNSDARDAEKMDFSTAGFTTKKGRDIYASIDDSAYRAFLRALNEIESYYKRPNEENAADLLAAIKNWNYVKSTSFFKSIVFPFKSVKSFAVEKADKER